MYTNDFDPKSTRVKLASHVDDFIFWDDPLKSVSPIMVEDENLFSQFLYKNTNEELQSVITNFFNWCNEWQFAVSMKNVNNYLLIKMWQINRLKLCYLTRNLY